jgi:beta-lactamase class D
MYDRNAAKWIRYNPPFAQKRLPPASTFDIANTLIGFETGVLSQGFLFRWNGEKRLFKSWERDLDIRDAFQNSCLPCFHQLSQAIGLERMQSYLDKLRYGNGVIEGRGETFWMKGGLRISADEQVELLRSLYDEKLMLSPRSMKEVKAMLLRDDTPRYKLFGKTGWLTDDLADPIGKPSLGWFVGFQERAGNVYFFATIIETEKTQADFASARVDISKRILKQLCVIE